MAKTLEDASSPVTEVMALVGRMSLENALAVDRTIAPELPKLIENRLHEASKATTPEE